MTAVMREAVAAAHRAFASTGMTDMVWGHISARDPEGCGVWMKASSWGMEEITPDRVVLVTPDGEVLEGSGKRHIEYPIHTELMARREDINAVVHSHGAGAATFASLDIPLRALTHDAVPFVQPDIPRFLLSSNLIRNADMGASLADCVGDAAGALIPGHGFVVVGESLAVAVMRAVLLERACRNQLDALAAGGPARWTEGDEIFEKDELVWHASQYQAGYDYLLRRVES